MRNYVLAVWEYSGTYQEILRKLLVVMGKNFSLLENLVKR